MGAEFGIGQSAVSQQLQVLRENGFASVRAEGRRRYYSLEAQPLTAIGAWLQHYGAFWSTALDELALEVERSKDRDERTEN